ncbi:MAG: GNAT family N-acetyltransferase [Oscillospiraceae bacterium]|nr:GNAT family N-acetyltransferase [Oscillospiraceae bacterium]
MSMKLFRYEDLPIINGRLVRLRPITQADTPDIVRWRNDPEVQQFFIFREPFTLEMHQNWLESKVYTGKVIQYIIEDKESGQSVGSVYFRDIDPVNESAEYGIFIGETSARGKGFGSETARLFTAFGLDVLKMHRISLRLIDGNIAAQRSYEKAGFVTEGVFIDMVKLDGKFTDIVFMAKLKSGA